MNKKVSLKEIVGTKIVYAIILTSYYWMWARTDWKDWYETVQSMLGVFLFSFFTLQMIRISKYKKEGIDEMAEQNLKRCDSICLKLLVGVMVAVAFGAAFSVMRMLLVLDLLDGQLCCRFWLYLLFVQ